MAQWPSGIADASLICVEVSPTQVKLASILQHEEGILSKFRPPDLWENAVRPVSPRGGSDEPVDEPQFGPRVGRRRGVEFP